MAHSSNCSRNTSDYMEEKSMKMTQEELTWFGLNDQFNVVAYSVMSAAGIILNTLVLITAYRKSARREIRSRTNVHYLVFHLTIADSLVSCITMPLEAAWRFTLQWKGDNLSCKVLMVVRAFGYYLSSAILVMICIDRLLVVTKPLITVQSGKQRKRAKLMVVFSWILSLLLSCPQAMMFRKVKHPYLEFYQCTTNMAIENYSVLVVQGDKAFYLFHGIDTDIIYMIYHLSFLIFVYFLPLCCLIISYIFIIYRLRTRDDFQPVSSLAKNPLVGKLPERKMKWTHLKMSLVQVASFAVFWAPYAFHQAWMLLDVKSAMQVSELTADLMLLTAVFNSCINPLVYGAHFYKDFKTCGRHKKNIETQQNLVLEGGSQPIEITTLF